jgi:hypothetical protein
MLMLPLWKVLAKGLADLAPGRCSCSPLVGVLPGPPPGGRPSSASASRGRFRKGEALLPVRLWPGAAEACDRAVCASGCSCPPSPWEC